MSSYDFFQQLIFILCSISLVVLIILLIKLIMTLSKVDKLVEDLTEKSRKVDGAFNAIDKMTDAVSKVNDKFIGMLFNGIMGISKKVKKNKEKEDDEDE